MSRPGLRRFSDRYARLVAAALASCEPAARPGYRTTADGATITERLLQCIWFDQLVRPDALRTVDGRPLRVLAPGFWNFTAGPDFQRAEIQVGDGPPTRGDVEVHFRAQEWTAHGHGRDPAYNDTVLHVVFAHGPDAPAVHTADGQPIPQFALADVLVDELDALRTQLDTEEYPYASTVNVGRCCADGLTGDSETYWRLIALAGEARLLLKASRAAALADDWDQVCWIMLLRALGYKPFAASCAELAHRAPYALLRELAVGPDAALWVEAVLLGMAGLLPEPNTVIDLAAAARLDRLKALWTDAQSRFYAEPMRPEAWQASHVRPANRPPRRLAAAAALVVATQEHGLAESLRARVLADAPPRAAWRALEAHLQPGGEGFWEKRGSFTGRPWSRPQSVVGPGRARIMAIDAVIPSLLAWARADGDAVFEHRLHAMVSAAPAQASNAKLRLALYRMNGAPDAWPRHVRTALHGQGLLHVLQEWCVERPSCDGCAVWRVLADGALAPQKEKGQGTLSSPSR